MSKELREWMYDEYDQWDKKDLILQLLDSMSKEEWEEAGKKYAKAVAENAKDEANAPKHP